LTCNPCRQTTVKEKILGISFEAICLTSWASQKLLGNPITFGSTLVELLAGPRAIIPVVFLASGGQKVSYT
jgi:hypothetical protein